MCKMTPIDVRLNLKKFILISCAVLELLRKVSQRDGIRPPPGEIGLTLFMPGFFAVKGPGGQGPIYDLKNHSR